MKKNKRKDSRYSFPAKNVIIQNHLTAKIIGILGSNCFYCFSLLCDCRLRSSYREGMDKNMDSRHNKYNNCLKLQI